jgi:hypothetical protein
MAYNNDRSEVVMTIIKAMRATIINNGVFMC